LEEGGALSLVLSGADQETDLVMMITVVSINLVLHMIAITVQNLSLHNRYHRAPPVDRYTCIEITRGRNETARGMSKGAESNHSEIFTNQVDILIHGASVESQDTSSIG
jgi:hypothetical protein